MTNYTRTHVYSLTATHCSACNRPLVDGTSIEKSMGPICRGKYGYEDAYPISNDVAADLITLLKCLNDSTLADRSIEAVVADDSRRAVNVLNHAVAIWAHEGTNEADTAICLEAMKVMGYAALADKIGSRLADVEIKVMGDRIILITPYNPDFVVAIKGVKGRRWDKETKVWTVPTSGKAGAWKAIQKHYNGLIGNGPKGMFRI